MKPDPLTLTRSPVEKSTAGGRLAAGAACFHCGLPVPAGSCYALVIEGEPRALCCRGCQAVAQAIVAAGLSEFYRHRDEPSGQAQESVPAALRELALYDRPELQKTFVRPVGESLREACLILEGIVCAACVWLNERHVSALPGVLEFRINYSTRRATLQWDERRIRLSDILAAISAIGYRAYPFDPDRQEMLHQRERATALRRIAVAGLCSMQVMMLAIALYAGDYQGMDEDIRRFLRWISLLLTLPVMGYAARPFFSAAWRDLRRLSLGMDVPVALAILGAFLASAWNTWRDSGEVYFDSVTMFTFFLLAGRFLEMSARHRAGRLAEELARILPATAVRLGPGGSQDTVAVAELAPADRVLIAPGATVPADGRIVEGASRVDEALLTGESRPVPKGVGDSLIGGSVNGDGGLVMQVERVGPDTVLSAIARLLDRAQSEKPRIAQLADRVAAGFVAGLLLSAAAVAWWWWPQGPDLAFRITLAVLVVTCPCALSLATPTAITAATGSLTRSGLLTTRGHALETLARITHLVFDKTGTLTYGRPRLLGIKTLRELDGQRCLELAAALERGSEHPVGRALAEAAAGALQAENPRNTPGRGIEGWVQGARYRIGTADFVAEISAAPLPDGWDEEEAGATWSVLGDEQGVLCGFRLADDLRPNAGETVAALRALGIEVLLLSGDRPALVAEIGRRLGIADAQGGLLPADKLQRLQSLQNRGAVVAMVGDGINDAPVLAAAQVSLAMGGGTALAQSAADMIVLAENPAVIVRGVQTARRTLTVIRQNLAWAILYNLLALPLAAAGWIAPWMAAVGMSLSSLLVVANALRLRAYPKTSLFPRAMHYP